MSAIAARAGVHYTTVSLALRNNPRIPELTRKRICQLAEEMGYRPDPMLTALCDYKARMKGRKSSTTVAYITNWPTRFGWRNSWLEADQLAGAEAAAENLGFRLEHFWLGEPGLSHSRLSHILQSRGIAGVIVAPRNHAPAEPLRFEWSKFCGIRIGSASSEALHRVCIDRVGAIRLAVQQARAAGYKEIGFALSDTWDRSCDSAWSSGFFSAQNAGYYQDQDLLFRFSGVDGAGVCGAGQHLSFSDWMTRYQPEVLISTAGLIKPHLESAGLAWPRDCGFVDVMLQQPDIRTAGVIQNARRVGELAVEMLAAQMRLHAFGPPNVPTSTLVETTWSEGESLQVREMSGGLAHVV